MGRNSTPQRAGMTTDHHDIDLPRRRAKLREKIVAGICGSLLAIFCVFVGVAFWASRQRIPVMTRNGFDSAVTRWNTRACANYVIATRVEGNQPALYEVRVVDNEVIQALRNGHPLRDQRTLGTWSVPGMFGTIERDLIHTESQEGQAEADLHLRAEFDAEWGFPRRYLRVQWGESNQVRWQVERFEPNPVDDRLNSGMAASE